MDYRTGSLAYELLARPDTLIIGGGSGTELLNAFRHGAKTITVVEMNRDIIDLMQGPYRRFSGQIYDSGPTRTYVEEGRRFVERTKHEFDLIQISLLEATGSASAGVNTINENYLFTVESIEACLRRLAPGGDPQRIRFDHDPSPGKHQGVRHGR